MEPKEMLEDLAGQARTLQQDLIELETQFNVKKEQYLKLQGAIEALTMLDKKEA